MRGFLLFLIVFTFCECRKVENPNKEISLYAINIFSVGKILHNEKDFQKKDILQMQEKLFLSPHSICDLQVFKKDWVFRIYGEAKFQLEHLMRKDSGNDWTLQLQEGVLFAKINQKLQEKEILKIQTPTTIIGVRGTQFQVEVDKNGNTKIHVFEGEVELTLAPSEKLLKNSSLVLPLLKQLEIPLNQNKTFELNSSFWKNLETISVEKKERFLEQVTKLTTMSTTKTDIKVKTAQEKEFASMFGVSMEAFQDETVLNQTIESKLRENSQVFLEIMQKNSNKKIGTIILHSGEEIKGLIEKKDKAFTVETPFGIKTYQESEILEVDQD